ncbi:hypothetical protein BANRA_00006 [Klebsiella pneumoniae]|uniref:hypothetical protein n=1 Tax=Klebsiella pneumoniae TaxID=573 RepID=UPI000F2438E7|nr:hypothetical protein BANRA_00006 [Klebsiella pneumoniae]
MTSPQIKRLIIALLVTLSLSLALPWLLQDRITAMAVIGLMMALWVLIFALMAVHERPPIATASGAACAL